MTFLRNFPFLVIPEIFISLSYLLVSTSLTFIPSGISFIGIFYLLTLLLSSRQLN